jgi:hypothetical protein
MEAKAKVADEAAHLANHPQHLGRAIAAGTAASSVAGVVSYQANSAIARHSKTAGPTLSSMHPNGEPTNLHITVNTIGPRKPKKGGK